MARSLLAIEEDESFAKINNNEDNTEVSNHSKNKVETLDNLPGLENNSSSCQDDQTECKRAKIEEAFKNARKEFSDSFSNEELNILEQLFRMANVAQDGLLNVSELKFFLDQHDYVISNEEARQIIGETDFDEDCALNFREFLFLCKRSNVSMQKISPHLEGQLEFLQESLQIRKIFQAIFHSIGFRPSIRETVEFFEHKIAELARASEMSFHSSSSYLSINKNIRNCQKCMTVPKSPPSSNDDEPPVENCTCKSSEEEFSEDSSVNPEIKDAHGGDAVQQSLLYDDPDCSPEFLLTLIDDPKVTDENESEHTNYKLLYSEDPEDDLLESELPEKIFTSEDNLHESLTKPSLGLDYNDVNCSSETSLTEYDYDLIVIGSGAGGSAAAKEAARLGKKVAICDFMMTSALVKSWSWRFGASCLNVGCVPKMLMHQSGLIGEFLDKRSSLPFGWFSPEDEKAFTNDWSILIDNIQSHIRTLNYERQFGLSYYKGIQYFNALCEFESPHLISVTHEDKRKEYLSGAKIVIAVGSLYRYLDVPGAPGNCITVDDIFSLRNHPGKVLIVGGGADAIECAGLLCALDIEVTIMSRSQLLKGYDRRMVTLIMETLHSRGVKAMIGFSPVEIIRKETDPKNLSERKSKAQKPNLTVVARHLQSGERPQLDFNTIILAIGKKPCTPLLKLEKAEVLIDEKTSKIWVDSQDMTTMENVFAIGDCASGRPSGTPIAYQAGVNLTKRLFEGVGVPNSRVMEYDQVLPKFLLTPVPYSCVGLSEEAAVYEHGEPNIQVYHSKVQPLQYQLATRYKDNYYAKLITLKTEDERVIGLHYLGPNAGEIIQGFTLALKLKAKKSDLDSMIAIHPTCAEIFTKMTNTNLGEFEDEPNC